jgi:hypothetical protein
MSQVTVKTLIQDDLEFFVSRVEFDGCRFEVTANFRDEIPKIEIVGIEYSDNPENFTVALRAALQHIDTYFRD